MNFNKILSDIEKSDPEVFERVSDRRDALKSFGSKVAVAALPLAVGALFNKAYGKNTDTLISVLNFALEKEFFEYNFYHGALATGSNTTSTLIVAADRAAFQMIADQEKAHLGFLRSLIVGIGGTPFTPSNYTRDAVTGDPYCPTSYDFTANGAFAVYTNYNIFLDVAQAFEDAGIRANLGLLPNLTANTNGVLTQFVQMNAVEARQASFIRYLRRVNGEVDYPKPWITNNVPPIIALQNFYLGEDNTTQDGVSVTGIEGVGSTISTTAASEAFDEPMSEATYLSLIAPFMM